MRVNDQNPAGASVNEAANGQETQAGRSEQVEALAAQYAAGSYQADSVAIRRGIISEALADGGK